MILPGIAAGETSVFVLSVGNFTTPALLDGGRFQMIGNHIHAQFLTANVWSFGGWEASGLGRELGRQGLDAVRRTKMVSVKHVPKAQDWWYPCPEGWFVDTGGRTLG